MRKRTGATGLLPQERGRCPRPAHPSARWMRNQSGSRRRQKRATTTLAGTTSTHASAITTPCAWARALPQRGPCHRLRPPRQRGAAGHREARQCLTHAGGCARRRPGLESSSLHVILAIPPCPPQCPALGARIAETAVQRCPDRRRSRHTQRRRQPEGRTHPANAARGSGRTRRTRVSATPTTRPPLTRSHVPDRLYASECACSAPSAPTGPSDALPAPAPRLGAAQQCLRAQACACRAQKRPGRAQGARMPRRARRCCQPGHAVLCCAPRSGTDSGGWRLRVSPAGTRERAGLRAGPHRKGSAVSCAGGCGRRSVKSACRRPPASAAITSDRSSRPLPAVTAAGVWPPM